MVELPAAAAFDKSDNASFRYTRSPAREPLHAWTRHARRA